MALLTRTATQPNPPIRDARSLSPGRGSLEPLWRSVVASEPAHAESVMRSAVDRLAEHLVADEAFAVVVAREAGGQRRFEGWHAREMFRTSRATEPPWSRPAPGPASSAARGAALASFLRDARGLRGAGRLRVLGSEELASAAPAPGAAAASECIVGFLPIASGVELLLGFERVGRDASRERAAFDRQDRDDLLDALHALARVARDAVLLTGFDLALSPREREALASLLRGSVEKQIAHAMGLTDRSLHQLVVAVYRKLRVSSRAELMAAFLRSPPAWAPERGER